MQSAIYERPALGQKAWLGSLYDARTDSFLGDNILSYTIPEGIEVVVHNKATTTIGSSDSYKERHEQMSIGPELTATILAGSANISGTGKYVSAPRASFPSVHRSWRYSLNTVEETLNLLGGPAYHYIDRTQLTRSEPTHVVIKIVWGASCVVAATRRLSANEDRNDAQKSLEDTFSALGGGQKPGPIRRIFSGQLQASTGSADQPLDVKCYSDLDDDGHTKVENLEQAKDYLYKLPESLDRTSDGKGVQIMYSLLPIGFISLTFGIPPSIAVGQPSAETISRLVSLLDEAEEAGQTLNAYYAYLKLNEQFISADHLMKVANEIRYADLQKSTLINNYSHCLKAIRQGTPSSQGVWALLDNFATSESSPRALCSLAWMEKEKVDFIEAAVAQGVQYVGYNTSSVDDLVRAQSLGILYILYLDSKVVGPTPEWQSVSSLFLDFPKQGKCTLAVVDCDATGHKIKKATIAHYEAGNILAEDYVQEQQELSKKNRIFYFEEQVEPIDPTDLPAQRQAVNIPCPGRKCDPSVTRHWVCARCQLTVEYGRDDFYFYCGCGRFPFRASAFKCCDLRHGSDPFTPNDHKLHQSLGEMPPPNELNILILGETGVGKSTFINAFVNYLTYDELNEAMKTPQLNWVIPCAFSTQIRNPMENTFIQKNIFVGHDDDEHAALKGKSATQKCTAYAIYVKDQLVRLIDTPGMGDTRGPEADRENMSDVLSVLRSYDHLHGIIILLKPNQPRLTFMFRFIVQELLGHLHRSAADNMVYAFTNTRGTNFAPGDSYGPLQELLKEFKAVLPPLTHNNVYCFDSESFRYLAAKKQVGIDMGEIEDVRRSWIKSSTESQRLREHFGNLEPHPVTHTVSLNATRYLIESLIAPMRQISKTILSSIAESEKRKAELQKTTATGEDLKKKLKIPKSTCDVHKSDQPVTACNHLDCARKVAKEMQRNASTYSPVQSTFGDEENKIRKSLCHNPCSLREVQAYKPGAAGLNGCAAFYNNHGICRTCKHGWQDHQHILVWYTEKTEIIDDPEVVSLLAQTNNEAQAKTAALNALDRQVAEFKEEHRMIQEAAAKFTVYMQKNSITVYNDATLAYLRHLIKDEDNKVQMGGDDTRLEALKKERDQYKAYVELISEARERGVKGAVPDEKGISQIAQELYNMKHYGKDLWRVAQAVSKVYAATFRETKYHVRRPRRGQNYSKHSYPGSPHRSMLHVGPSSFQGRPNSMRSDVRSMGRRGSHRSQLPSFRPVAHSPSGHTHSNSNGSSWQADYAPHRSSTQSPAETPTTRGFLPFDDEITPAQQRPANNTSQSAPISEKQGLDTQSPTAVYDAPPPYSSPPSELNPKGNTAAVGQKAKKRASWLKRLFSK